MKKEIIIYKESLFQSIVADIFTFGVLAGLMFFNHSILDDSKFAGFVFVVLWIIFITAKVSAKKRTFIDKEKAIEHIKNS